MPNKCVFGTYIFLWFGLCINFTLGAIISTLTKYDKSYLDSIVLFQLNSICKILYSLFFVIIDCMILYTLLLLSNKFEEEKMALIASSLRKSYYSQGSSIEEEYDEEEDRARFSRRS